MEGDFMQLLFKKIKNTLVITMSGELDQHVAANIRGELDRKIRTSGAQNIIFNMSKLKFMDSSGLGVIIGRYKTTSALGGKTKIAAPTPEIKRLIKISGLDKIISVCSSIETAMKGM